MGLFWHVSFGLKPWVTCRRVCKSHHDHDWGKISLVPLFVEAAVACGLSARYCLLLPGSQSPYSLSASEDKLLEARSSQKVILSHAGSQSMPSSYWNGKYFVSPPRSVLWHRSTSGTSLCPARLKWLPQFSRICYTWSPFWSRICWRLLISKWIKMVYNFSITLEATYTLLKVALCPAISMSRTKKKNKTWNSRVNFQTKNELWHNRYLDPLQCDQHHFFDCLRHVPTVPICGIPLAGRACNLAWKKGGHIWHMRSQGLEIHKLEVDLASNASLQDPRISRYEASSYHFHVERGGGRTRRKSLMIGCDLLFATRSENLFMLVPWVSTGPLGCSQKNDSA